MHVLCQLPSKRLVPHTKLLFSKSLTPVGRRSFKRKNKEKENGRTATFA